MKIDLLIAAIPAVAACGGGSKTGNLPAPEPETTEAAPGMAPHRYLTHLRIARAKDLLAGGVRASDVAPLVGICDQAQLTRHFRRLVGTTPARYARDRRTVGRAASCPPGA
jgi:hypothetical protein